ncbi:MAG: RimK family alpha-L-glutamate ligase [Candidatus Nezhaarchaeota archaeon]|nr:RimK family alpha-L-glutamate ligase [Candidatus Nezhaarchaeota archaeon]MCX8141561.1 RimK family alpha-L-glutamate ligase [Candidatus Nezhaarchaeota archaeon]MDW8049828.1 RimK family alpha-L-glutamate ligase [Nitrososphaerota archaeon]
MKIGIFTRNERSWCSRKLRDEIIKAGHEPYPLRFSRVRVNIGLTPSVVHDDLDLIKELSIAIVRPIGRGSVDECFFRIDLLHKLERSGLPVVNRPSAIEKCMSKFTCLAILEEHGLPVPKTIVTENPVEALRAYHEMGGDVVIKPLYGSRGFGISRLRDEDVARRVFADLHFMRHILYVQEFIPHGGRDIRMFVVGGEIVASMQRLALSGWKTNIALGAKPVPLTPSEELIEMALKSCEVLGCEIAGVDIIESPSGFLLTEVNSQPGWMGLQAVTKVNVAAKIVKYLILKAKK